MNLSERMLDLAQETRNLRADVNALKVARAALPLPKSSLSQHFKNLASFGANARESS